MKSWFDGAKFGFGVMIAGLFVVLTCCTKVDDKVGLDLVPNDQQMSIRIDTLKGNINTYVTFTDSMKSSGLNIAYIGQTRSSQFGTTTAGALMQYSYLVRTDTAGYGANITPDSMWLITTRSFVTGDSMRTQKFYVYDMIKPFDYDTVYYNGMDYSEFYDPTPMFEFSFRKPTLSGSTDTMRFKVVNQTAAMNYWQRLAEADTTLYATDSLFRAKFNGLYIAPAPDSPTKAAIYSMPLGYSEDYTLLAFFAHSYEPEAPTEVADTIVRFYTFSDDNTDYSMTNVTASSVKHDYSATAINPVAGYNADLGNPVSPCYVQGMVGATTTLEFTDAFWDELKALVPADKSIFINQAVLYVPVAEQSADAYDTAPSRVGSYLRYSTLSPIADYYYTYEYSYSTELNYDGYLNRSNGWYRLDISYYLQRVLNGKTTRLRFTLAPDAYAIYAGGEVVLKGSTTDQLRVRLTYSLITNQ